jgi:hypothetical protein
LIQLAYASKLNGQTAAAFATASYKADPTSLSALEWTNNFKYEVRDLGRDLVTDTISETCFYFVLFESSWSIVLTMYVLDRLTWSELSICDMRFLLVL